jgi:hypothetical protein
VRCASHSLSARNVRVVRCVLLRRTRRFVAKKSQESQDQIAKGAAVMNDAVNAMSSVTAYAPAPAPARWSCSCTVGRAEQSSACRGTAWRQQGLTRRGSVFGSICAVGSVGTRSSLRGWGAFRRYSLQTTICGLYNEHIAISLRAKILDMSGQTSHAQLARTAHTASFWSRRLSQAFVAAFTIFLMNINKVVLYIYGAFLSEHQRTIPQV